MGRQKKKNNKKERTENRKLKNKSFFFLSLSFVFYQTQILKRKKTTVKKHQDIQHINKEN